LLRNWFGGSPISKITEMVGAENYLAVLREAVDEIEDLLGGSACMRAERFWLINPILMMGKSVYSSANLA
jgi:hypothetical protein